MFRRVSGAPLGLKLTPPGGGVAGPGQANFQALIYLNGWLVGRYINNLGPQNTFYLPQGLLRTDGRNTLAIAEWSLSAGAGGLGQVSLVPLRDRARRDSGADRAQPRLSRPENLLMSQGGSWSRNVRFATRIP